MLHTTGTVHDGNMLRYRASKFDCDACALKMRARDEFHLAAIVQNLKTMALRLLGPPIGQVCASIA